MWRWVKTRGLVLTAVLSLFAPVLFAQTTDLIASLDQPDAGVVQSGEILIKGWALDPVGTSISKIELVVDDQVQYQTIRNLPRIDIIEAFPNYPGIHNIAPGFQTGFNAARFTNGPHTVFVRVTAADNRVFDLGRRTINIDNTQNQSPFGSLDIPDGSATFNASNSFPVLGWAADTEGIDHIDVQVDNGSMQEVMYGDGRPDVAIAFPDFPSALFSGFIANIDTTRLQDGLHQLAVYATDKHNPSSRRQIGRRTIQVLNSQGSAKPFGFIDEPKRDAILFGNRCGVLPRVSPPVNPQSHITPVRGWALDVAPRGDVGRVSYVELLIDGVRWISTDDCSFSSIFSAYTNCYGLPRYDVERLYPNYPDSPRAGFMFTLDVGALLALGVSPGHHVLKVRVGDQQGTISEIPNRDGMPVFFQCAEDTFTSPVFGFIDIPTPSDFVKGTVTFQGWALGESNVLTAVDIIIDGDRYGSAQLGFPRPDVAQQYPHIFNSTNSGWRFVMDTTKLVNGRHRLTVRGYDLANHAIELASQDFYTANPQ
jgi:N-acetylmuramoyl-L-alanine amidase